MPVAMVSQPITGEDLLALPDDGVQRWLVRGELREKHPAPGEQSMTIRNRWHSRIMATIAKCLGVWRDSQPLPRGEVLCGEAGVRLSRDPETTVGIDVGYVSPEVVARQSDETTIIDGVPLLIVEILSPSDTTVEIEEKTNLYLAAGVALIWIVNPYRRTVTVIRSCRRADCERE